MTRSAEPKPAAPAHEVQVIDGRFASAGCSCGWRSSARRARSSVRAEARDHALLYADGREVPSAEPVVDVRGAGVTVVEDVAAKA